MTLCSCALQVLCSLASVSVSKAIAVIHCAGFLKVCSCIQFLLFVRQVLHAYYVESYELVSGKSCDFKRHFLSPYFKELLV